MEYRRIAGILSQIFFWLALLLPIFSTFAAASRWNLRRGVNEFGNDNDVAESNDYDEDIPSFPSSDYATIIARDPIDDYEAQSIQIELSSTISSAATSVLSAANSAVSSNDGVEAEQDRSNHLSLEARNPSNNRLTDSTQSQPSVSTTAAPSWPSIHLSTRNDSSGGNDGDAESSEGEDSPHEDVPPPSRNFGGDNDEADLELGKRDELDGSETESDDDDLIRRAIEVEETQSEDLDERDIEIESEEDSDSDM